MPRSMPNIEGMGYCYKCVAYKPETDFSKRSQSISGLQPWCRNCVKFKQKMSPARKHREEYFCPQLPPTMKRCNQCREVKGLNAFASGKPLSGHFKDGIYSWCFPCSDAYDEQYLLKNKDRLTAYRYKRWREDPRAKASCTRSKIKLKTQIFEHYGWACVCCGEDNPIFLSLGHINNDGAKERQELFNAQRGSAHFYRVLRRRGFPSGYQTLCFNCNMAKHLAGGVCPHQKLVQTLIKSAETSIV